MVRCLMLIPLGVAVVYLVAGPITGRPELLVMHSFATYLQLALLPAVPLNRLKPLVQGPPRMSLVAGAAGGSTIASASTVPQPPPCLHLHGGGPEGRGNESS